MSEKETRLLAEFPPVSTEAWEAAIQKDLKGADYAKRLHWQTDEGITVKPYYRSEDLRGREFLGTAPGQFPYTRGTNASANWKIREEIEVAGIAEANQSARRAIAKGADEIAFVGVKADADLPALLAGLSGVAVHFIAGAEAPALLPCLIEHMKQSPLCGSIDYDPLANPAAAVVFALAVPDGFRPFGVDGGRFHEAGGTAVQELGFALAAGVEALAALDSAALSAGVAAAKMFFTYTVGSNYFFEIAKFRAARLLWARAVSSFQPANVESAKAVIYARTARWNKTIYDPYVNMLRTSTEAMSAALGGVDSLAVGCFNETYQEPDEFSKHLARNTQIILKQEAWLDRVTDPAAGSYYIEVLTDSLAREAWKAFQEVEAAGGFRKAEALMTAQVDKARTAKEAAIAARRRSILGTNQYPNLKEKMLPEIKRSAPKGAPKRGAEVFESIRLRTERHAAAGGKTPVFLLAEIGNLKMSKARSGFVTNFFGSGGFTLVTRSFADVDQAAQAAAELKADAVVLCSSDEEYTALAGPLRAKLSVPVVVAGYPKDAIEQLKKDGVVDFVHVRSNAAEMLTSWQQKLGVKE
jgi:methylmalonyl-CoA mutase